MGFEKCWALVFSSFSLNGLDQLFGFSFGLSSLNICQSLSNVLSWNEHLSILEQRLELETGDRDRCAVLLVLKSLSTVEIRVEEEEKCVGLTSRETGVGNDSRGLNCKNCEMDCEGQVTPKVRSELKPKLGLEFDCCDNVFNFYNTGPVDIPVGEDDDSKYYLSPTFKFEQCLVKGCHKRLRIVHTIEFSNGGSSIQIMRVAVYEEQWVSPANLPDPSDLEFDLKPFSQRKRTRPSELTGSWKVFEVSGTPVFGEEIDQMVMEQNDSTPYVLSLHRNSKEEELAGESSLLWRRRDARHARCDYALASGWCHGLC
ncbi:PREDICTED: uncharacterized protein LOC103331664 [Prunus mume]|uniref:Uncharacterized protein LOC103331664 n=1 Tax=Prunus mume TaxID=102107 RepID=A0ABM1LQR1_PRUMU|nr:PREDICTED: uncharacterized protein LOC103331664 [Prunus mume]